MTNKRVRSCLFHRQCFMSVCPQNSREQPTAYLFGSSLSIPLARYTLRCLSDSSLSLTIPLSQAPRAEWYYQPLTSPRGSVSSFRKGYLVGTASYKGITPMHVSVGYSRRNWRRNQNVTQSLTQLHVARIYNRPKITQKNVSNEFR